MRFTNFDLDKPFGSITLVGLGCDWDIHNWADLVAIDGSADRGVGSLEWRVPADVDNPWGCSGNDAIGCRILFSGVKLFDVKRGTAGADRRDIRTVAALSKVVPEEWEYPFKQQWAEGELFYLRVETEDAGRIDIDADAATLEAVRRLDV